MPIVQILIRYLSHSQSLHLLRQSRHSLNTVIPSSVDLTCFAMENIFLLPHLKQMYKEFSRASCGFSSCLITCFTFSLAESKTGCSKIGSVFVPTLFFLYLKINMDKTSEKVTKDPKRQERGKKSHKTYMKRLKEKLLEDNQLPTPFPTDRTTPSTSSSTGDFTPSAPSHTTKPNDTYVYGVGMLAVFAIGVCVFFTYNGSQAKNKKTVNEKQDQPPKRRNML